MAGAAHFSSDYATARGRFVEGARAAGASLESVVAPVVGPGGEPLAIDEARFDSPGATRTLIVSSGLHGVEGLVGSALQLAWLETRGAGAIPPGVRVVFVHGLNPYGLAWLRRANEHNVDLNRNFLDDRSFLDDPSFLEDRQVYERVTPFLNPSSPPPRFEPYRLVAARWVLSVGLARLRRALPVGQYHDRRGLFYGGDAPEWTTSVVRGRAGVWTRDTGRAIHLDVHSGLGRWGDCRLLWSEDLDSSRSRWTLQSFGELVATGGRSGSYRARGTMTDDLRVRTTPCDYYGLTMEFGTYSSVHVLGALRAENRAHHFATRESGAAIRARRQLVEAFVPHSSAWRAAVVGQGLAVIDRALEVCRTEGNSRAGISV